MEMLEELAKVHPATTRLLKLASAKPFIFTSQTSNLEGAQVSVGLLCLAATPLVEVRYLQPHRNYFLDIKNVVNDVTRSGFVRGRIDITCSRLSVKISVVCLGTATTMDAGAFRNLESAIFLLGNLTWEANKAGIYDLSATSGGRKGDVFELQRKWLKMINRCASQNGFMYIKHLGMYKLR